DAILTPATPSSAFGVADENLASDPVKMYLQDIFTVTVNMAGLPGLTVPAGLDHKGLPLGLQLIGKPFEEESLFKTAHVIEQAAGRFSPAKWRYGALSQSNPSVAAIPAVTDGMTNSPSLTAGLFTPAFHHLRG